MHVGFVGTGNMGDPMGLNVLKAGHQLTVYDRRREATAELERRGARRAADLVELGREVRATLLSLPDERVVETVVFGERPGTGLIDGSRAGDVIIDLSTVSPSGTRRLAARTA
jgi:2-hydroxy-3-oxopropionate reductase